MKKVAIWIAFALLAAALLGLSIWQNTSAPKISDDPLCQGIISRWNAGLPDGFTKVEAADQAESGEGYSFARLTYDRDVSGILEKWQDGNPAHLSAFNSLADSYAACGYITAEHAGILEANRPAEGGYLSYTMEREGTDAKIVLLYDADTHNMYVMERLLP